jgi:hypothetical protein
MGRHLYVVGLVFLQRPSLQEEAKTCPKRAHENDHVVGESTRVAASETLLHREATTHLHTASNRRIA